MAKQQNLFTMQNDQPIIEKSAMFSEHRHHRYTLWRTWDKSAGYIMFIGLNPSVADERLDDPTIRRCMGYSKDWGYGGLIMTNLFAFRATNPQYMRSAKDPIGSQNDYFLRVCAGYASINIAAWGTNGTFLQRDKEVIKLIPNLHYLKLTKQGFPAHPLYLPKDLKPIKWN